MSNKNMIEVDSSKFYKDMDLTKDMINSALRHGVSNAINLFRDSAKSNLSATGYKVTTSSQYGVGLIEGIRTFMLQDYPVGVVSILGNKTNDGTWRLRFFNAGTKQRTSKSGKNLGKIPAKWFFENAINANTGSVEPEIEAALDEAINKINTM